MSDIIFSGATSIPLIPSRNFVAFPSTVFPMNVGRPKSVISLEEASENGGYVAVFCQKEPEIEDPKEDDLYKIGTLVRIIKSSSMEGNVVSVICEGVSRIRMLSFSDEEGYSCGFEILETEGQTVGLRNKKARELKKNAERIFEVSPDVPSEAVVLLGATKDYSDYCDIVISNLNMPAQKKQEVLEELSIEKRISLVGKIISTELSLLNLSTKISSTVRDEIDKSQKEYYLREQLRVIKKELGEEVEDESDDDLGSIKSKIYASNMPEYAEKAALKEYRRLRRINPNSTEHTVSRTYLEWLVDLPWSISSQDMLDISEASEILDEDHYGMEDVKDRVLEFLSVRSLKKDMKGPIMCLIGPPGVGKTSLSTSLAKALGRKVVRISLGGVRDESEIRGHRRTYIGSMPGKIIKALAKAKTKNPVIILDEIDKMTSDHRGDPAAAMLEVLDPEQNSTFQDHYIDMPFDLSECLFIATANSSSTIPKPLYDRMEVINIPSYTKEEKLQICKKHIVGKEQKENGLEDDSIMFSDEAIEHLISGFTREAGVRSLKREVSSVFRKLAKKKVANELEDEVVVTKDLITEIKGSEKYLGDEDLAPEDMSGIATALAWTSVGGSTLLIEANKTKGKGSIKLTGSLGSVMKESVDVALTYIKNMSDRLGIDDEVFEKNDFHIHVPSGATPKDGPSAGVTMMTALASLLMDKPVSNKVAMTGEASLRGRVLPVGGIKEKVLAARRLGIEKILIPSQNKKDLEDIPEELLNTVEVVLCKSMEQVLKEVFAMEL
jgi:ATP-dependent Lon protease